MFVIKIYFSVSPMLLVWRLIQDLIYPPPTLTDQLNPSQLLQTPILTSILPQTLNALTDSNTLTVSQCSHRLPMLWQTLNTPTDSQYSHRLPILSQTPNTLTDSVLPHIPSAPTYLVLPHAQCSHRLQVLPQTSSAPTNSVLPQTPSVPTYFKCSHSLSLLPQTSSAPTNS